MPEITSENRDIVFREFRVNFHAVFSGVIIAMSLQLLLTLLGNAIGLSLVDASTPGVVREPTAGPILWTLGIPLFCIGAGGFISALVAKADTGGRGVLHGFLVWGLSVLFIGALFVLSSCSPAQGVRAITSGMFWLAFFSACLSLCGGLIGGFLSSQPLHGSLYRGMSERRIQA